MMSSASLQSLVIAAQSCDAIDSLGKRLLPIPTHVTPALNHPSRFSLVGLTPPVTMIWLQGIGARRPLTNAGPRTSPGNTLQRSQPSSCALPTSDTVPHPGQYGTRRLLHIGAISGLKRGPTTKLAPSWRYIAAVPGSTTEPIPMIMPGSSLFAYFTSSPNTS